MFYVCILYSKSIDKFDIGYTVMELSERLRRHLSSHKGFAGRAKDWEVVYFELIDDKTKAILCEKEIKNWKSSAKIIELISK
ncbi:GIY-YIG nuclease family protein [Flavobacterium sp. F-380]|uniref:GIY-YIG nuclease family protein n=1 Tax=Flavobacterium kayseriense TaxID=2764714 RepID=A0ABR7J711_9FLAO|nr:GIY-YIG nuclease family protein [Flavobacterium kayseriense]MBC5841325.1 GIY-YIG nuclease family protein [Flavobacterium kayseriense]MBC5847853.1 GIY-YIG nuclease family protein [Flavobacterium kayseriense]MBU0939828.1 GIY-YIG nuclease family protein [Bacteroidota bacterium]